MLKITRNKIKGSSLDNECKNARVCREEYNSNIYCFCYGRIDLHYDDYTDKCKNCKACVINMPDLKKDWEESFKRGKRWIV